ncbi:MAG: Glu-tRNA(Gln) amidotransferase subunit GatD [Candidatus Micrarchaeota archaeon]|nr:Glu-tRNA(Gln) amidotransferase subunit GatD [Candidatus Micrarchaeota archaeon]
MAKAKKEVVSSETSHASGANSGDRVRISCGTDSYTGVLLPRAAGAEDFITLKLSSGYNIGIKKSRISGTEVLEQSAVKLVGATEKKQHLAKQSAEGKVSLLACGGTIVNRIDYRSGAVYPASTTEEILAGLPKEAREHVRPKILFSVASEDMAPAHWSKVAEAAAVDIKDGAQGVIVTHGTDTMHYTSAALSFMLQNIPVPIILTGSQRSSDRGSSDAETNFRASLAAANADISGVFICMHENMSDESCLLHFGTKVRKMHTTRRDAFRSINVQPAARVFPGNGKVEKLSADCPARKPGAKMAVDTALNTNVAMQYIYPGIKPAQISALSKYDGIVLVGMGLAHLPINLGGDPLAIPILKEAKALAASGIPVVLTSQCIYGRINMDVYTNGRALKDAGIIGNLCDMTPETAYVKLMWVLGHEKKVAKVKELMESNIAGEISERTEIVNY